MKHGYSSPLKRNRTYAAWNDMRKRCNNPNNKRFYRYGGRGISVCKRWDDFALFLSDMGEVPEGLSLDRIDNDGNYEPSNCRWADKFQQAQNSSAARIIEFRGERLRIGEWEGRMGLSQGALRHRIKSGWSLKDALTTPRMGRVKA